MPTDPLPDYSVVILGAGCAGLAAAERLCELGSHFEVFERNPYAGGRAYTHEVDGFLFDQGPHVSFTQRSGIQSRFARAVDDRFFEENACLLNYWQGRWVRHPVQCNLYGLPPRVVEQCILDFVATRCNHNHGAIRTYADWCYQSLGRAFSEHFTFPYTRKYWTTNPDTMCADWIGRRMYAPKLKDIVRGALAPSEENHHYITRFRYPHDGGFRAYLQGFMTIQGVNLCHEVDTVDLKHRKVTFANGRMAHFDVLISSLPVPELVARIRDVPQEITDAARRLSCTSLVLVNVGINRCEGLPEAHWIYFYDENIVFSRGSLPHRFSPNNAPKGCGSIQVELYHSKYRPLPCQDVLNRAMEDMYKTGLLQKDDPILVTNVRHIPYANILFDLDRASNLAVVNNYLAANGIISCGRYGEWAYYWSDDAVNSGWRAAEEAVRTKTAR